MAGGIVAFKWAEEGENQLLVLMNRENWGSRIIRAASWNENGQILRGIDERYSGTWFGISKKGRVSFVLSSSLVSEYRREITPELCASHFLDGTESPQEFAESVEADMEKKKMMYGHGEFNLIVADLNLCSMFHIMKGAHNPDVLIEEVPYGTHTLSLRGLDCSNYRKDTRLRELFTHMIEDLKIDDGDHQLPQLENIAGRFMYDAAGGMHALFSEDGDEEKRYGITSTTALLVKRTKKVMFFERFREESGVWNPYNFDFDIQ
ncbi:hypothetical protein CARUB_v10025260mg [Capsella rubella]|uniref:Transport and Golgi organization protein 2 homolog n=1 Tax=Capsella rubella TaxID=81985 RepID=R0G0V5_9BRAS|nr:hypothetical protein CARUB_v10025260mg [Capsella rubella]